MLPNNRFGLIGFPGRAFRVAEDHHGRAVKINDTFQVQIESRGKWMDFCRSTASELSAQACDIPEPRQIMSLTEAECEELWGDADSPATPHDALLAACKDMLEKIHKHYPHDWQGTKMTARAAIAKAKGSA